MITAQLQGRRLILTVQTEADEPAIEPFRVDPLSAKVGRQLSARYLMGLSGAAVPEGEDIGADMIRAIGPENYARLDDELRQEEAELIMQAAHLWQTVAGMEGVRALLDGEDGPGKARQVFLNRMAPLLPQIRHHLESARLTLAESSPATGSPQDGEQPDSAPQPTAPTNSPDATPPARSKRATTRAGSDSPQTTGSD